MRNAQDSKCARVTLAVFIEFAVMIVTVPGALQAASTQRQIAVPPPPMGWSSWNSFSNTVDADIVDGPGQGHGRQRHAEGGLSNTSTSTKAGGWASAMRGQHRGRSKAWPALAPGEHAGDMSNIVRFIHGLGLKAGIYTDAGKDGCSLYPDLGPVLSTRRERRPL